jgi:hypothetical protein
MFRACKNSLHEKPLTWNFGSLHMVGDPHPCWSPAYSQLPHFRTLPHFYHHSSPHPPLPTNTVFIYLNYINRPDSSSIGHSYCNLLFCKSANYAPLHHFTPSPWHHGTTTARPHFTTSPLHSFSPPLPPFLPSFTTSTPHHLTSSLLLHLTSSPLHLFTSSPLLLFSPSPLFPH